ncbi:MAG: hypothetical protein ABWY66_13070 [Xanthobacteraceae bacterium]|jgi:hypothetical protein
MATRKPDASHRAGENLTGMAGRTSENDPMRLELLHAMVIAEAKMRGGIPAIYQWRAFADDGGLISYGPSIKHAYEQAGRYVARIILGEKPAAMECSTPGGFDLVVKEATATKLGLLPVPPRYLEKLSFRFRETKITVRFIRNQPG